MGLHASTPSPNALQAGQHLALRVAAGEGVLELHGLVANQVVHVARPQGLREPVASVVRAADVPDLALVHEIVQRAQRLHGDGGVLHVHLAANQCSRSGGAAATPRTRRGCACGTGPGRAAPGSGGREAALRGDEHALAPAVQPLPEELLRLARAVTVGGVDEVDARVKRAVQHPPPLVFGAGDALHEPGRIAERHGAEGERCDLQTTAPQRTGIHGEPPGRPARAGVRWVVR